MNISEVENIDFHSITSELTFKLNPENGFVEGYYSDENYEVTLSPLNQGGETGWYAEILGADGTGVAVNLDSDFIVTDHLADM